METKKISFDEQILEAIRVSHCAHEDIDHKCVGTCSITPTGLRLSCELCGDNDESGFIARETKRLRRVARALGLDVESLHPATITRAVKELVSENCPGCGAVFPLDPGSSHFCRCGEWYWSYTFGWSKNHTEEAA